MKKVFALVLAAVMLLSVTGCTKQTGEATEGTKESAVTAESADQGESSAEESSREVSMEVTEESSEEEEEVIEIIGEPVDYGMPLNVMVLNGTTGFGMAQLINEGIPNYNFTIETDAANISAALINGSVDIAALPTNAAAALYNKTEGQVKLLALNTLGVLYLVTTDGTEITSFEDLKGLTVYAPAQNPTFVFQYLCEANGLVVGEDVIIDNTYAQPADLRTAVANNEVAVAVLPEPMVTMTKAANENMSVEMDLTAEWEKVNETSQLVQGCLVVRAEFAETFPGMVTAFLENYQASIEYMNSGDEGVAAAIEASGVFANGAVAAKAIPNCNIVYIAGADMQATVEGFFEALYGVAPQSIGGALPGEDFYYIGE